MSHIYLANGLKKLGLVASYVCPKEALEELVKLKANNKETTYILSSCRW